MVQKGNKDSHYYTVKHFRYHKTIWRGSVDSNRVKRRTRRTFNTIGVAENKNVLRFSRAISATVIRSILSKIGMPRPTMTNCVAG